MKKVLAMLLAAVMLLGCTSALAAEAPAGATVITLYQNSGAGNAAGGEVGSTQAGYDMVQNYIYEQTGVWVDSLVTPMSTSTEQLNLMLAGGEDVDLFWGDWRNFSDTGMIQPWNDLLEKYPLIYETWASWDAWAGVTDAEGNIWGMPRSTPTTPYQMFFRADWLDELGMDIPTNMDEVNEYLYAVKELDPYGNGLTVPLAARSVSELQYCFLGGYVDGGNGMWIDEDGLVKPVYLADGYLDFLKQMHQWYQDGILHKESFSWDTKTIRNEISMGAAAATATWYSHISSTGVTLAENLAKDPNYDSEKYTYPMVKNDNGIIGPNGNFIETRSNVGVTALMLHANCNDVDAALKFINWQYESWENYYTATWGLKDYMWRYDPNDPLAETETFTTTGWTDENGTAMYKTADGELSYDNTLAYYSDFCTSIGLPTEVLGKKYDASGKQNMHNFWLANHLDDFDVTNEPGIEYGIVWDTVALKDNVPSYTDLTTYVSEQLPKFVIGERDIAEWDTFLSELDKMGLNDLCQEYTRQYEILAK